MTKDKNNFIKTILIFTILIAVSLVGYLPVFGYGGGGGYSFFPTQITAVNSPLTISPYQNGIGIMNDEDSNVEIVIDEYTVNNETEFILSSSYQEIQGINFKVFEINATNIDGEKVDDFTKDLEITISSSKLVSEMFESKLYYIDPEDGKVKAVEDVNYDYDSSTISFLNNKIYNYIIINDDSFMNTSSIEETDGQVVLGVEETQYSKINNLTKVDSDIVEVISFREAEEVYLYNKYVKLDENLIKLYTDIINNETVEIAINQDKYAIAYFINNGSQTTKNLGAGERAGVLNSYKNTYGKLPASKEDWQDVIKIANGRWPSIQNEEKENKVKSEIFKSIYKRNADMNNSHDNAAVTIISYGLRPNDRNMESEKAAIKIFKSIYNYNPTSAVDWDIVRAIAYSGATR